MILLQADDISKSFGDKILFEDIGFCIQKGKKIGLVGQNGVGKTTLLKIIADIESADSGKFTKTQDIKLGFLEQDPVLDPNKTILEQVYYSSDKVLNTIKRYEAALLLNDERELQEATDEMDTQEAWEFESKAKDILSRLQISDFNAPIKNLSGGQKKRVAMANVLINEPDILLFDEPTNHLDMEMTEWLEEYLAKSSLTLLMVTHDRYFLNEVCNETFEIDEKKLFRYEGNYIYYLEKREERLFNENAEIDKARNLMRKEIEWVRRMPKARTHKSKARLNAYEDLKVVGTQKKHHEDIQIRVQEERLGKKILNIIKLSKKYDDNILLDNFNYTFNRGEKIGIIGKNGSGKTTLLNIICGIIEADSGRIETGTTVKLGYHTQEGIKTDDSKQLISTVKDIAEVITLQDGKKITAARLLSLFRFPYKMHNNYVYTLSGGEKKRLALLTVLMKNPNVLILDEPTNDMDVPTLNVLEEYLINFPGCVLIVSHDRFFMDKVVDHLLVFKGSGETIMYPGNYTNYRNYVKEQKKISDSQKIKPQKKVKVLKRKKFTYKHKLELVEVEEEIKNFELKKIELEDLICSGSLTNDELIDKSQLLSKVIKDLEIKTERWIELEELKE